MLLLCLQAARVAVLCELAAGCCLPKERAGTGAPCAVVQRPECIVMNAWVWNACVRTAHAPGKCMC